MDHDIVELPQLTVIGLGLDCPGWDASGIGELWERFSARSSELPAGPMWGVSFPRDGGFHYVSAAEVPVGTAVPDGMEERHIPAGRYLRYGFNAPPPEMQGSFGRMYRDLIPAAGEAPREQGACLELYSPDCWDEATGRLKAELYVPLA